MDIFMYFGLVRHFNEQLAQLRIRFFQHFNKYRGTIDFIFFLNCDTVKALIQRQRDGQLMLIQFCFPVEDF